MTARKLRAIGVTRLVEVRTCDADALRRAVGSQAAWLQQLARGEDDRPVQPHRESKSCGAERTFDRDLETREEVAASIRDMTERCAAWLARHDLTARTVTIKIRYGDFTTITRSQSAAPTREAGTLSERAVDLLARTEAGTRPVRLAGVSVHGLVAPGDEEDVRAATDAAWLPFDG